MSDKPTFVVIHGMHTSCKTVLDYVAHIVYGNPRIEAVKVGSHFVAICEFPPARTALLRAPSTAWAASPTVRA